jgi:hypothetical protein
MKIDLTDGQRKRADELRAKANAAFGGDCCLLGELRAVEASAETFALYCIPIPRKVADKIRGMLERERGKLAAKRTEAPPSGTIQRD